MFDSCEKFHVEILRIRSSIKIMWRKFYRSLNASTEYCGPPYKCREFGPRKAIS